MSPDLSDENVGTALLQRQVQQVLYSLKGQPTSRDGYFVTLMFPKPLTRSANTLARCSVALATEKKPLCGISLAPE